MFKKLIGGAALVAAFSLGYMVRGSVPGEPVAFAQGHRVFELRTYTAGEGKLDLLHARFKNHTLKFFKQYGMESILYGKPLDAPLSQNTMLYLLAYPNREAAKKSWDTFRADPEWVKVREASGVGQVKIDSVYFEPTDYSPMK
jgi:NIPSNAP